MMILTKSKNIKIFFIVFSLYIIARSFLFFRFGITVQDFLINFEGATFFLLELLPFYLIGLALIFGFDENVIFKYRLGFRSKIINFQFKKILIYTIIFVTLNFAYSILLFNYFFNFFYYTPPSHFVLLYITQILTLYLVSGMIVFLNQLNSLDYKNNILSIYLFILVENFFIFEKLLSKNIPLFTSWSFSEHSSFLKILILLGLVLLVYINAFNKSLNKDYLK